MRAALRKEIRLLLPAWIVAVAAATVPECVVGWGFLMRGERWPGGMEEMSLVFFAAGALLLSLASFGLEMSFGTFPSLLAQPHPRRTIWRMKIGLLALALATVMAAAMFSWWMWRFEIFDGFHFVGWNWREYACHLFLLALMAFVGGLWTTLLLRQVTTAFWFAVIVPFILFNVFGPLAESFGLAFDFELHPLESFALVTGGYAALGYSVARWLFLHAQDKPEREATEPVSWSFLPVFRTRRGPLAALLVKELRLQQGTLVIAAGLVLLHLAAIAVPDYLPPAVANQYAWFQSIWIVWFVAPLLVSCASVAEERRGRTLETTLCLPVGGLQQFTIKILVVYGLGILLGALLPWLLEQLRPGAPSNTIPITGLGLPHLLVIAVILSGLGCYASSMSSTLLQALGSTLLLGLAAPLVMAAFFNAHWIGWNFRLAWPGLIAISLCLGYANFRQSRITWRQLFDNGKIWLAAILVAKFLWFILGGSFALDAP